ncbi:ATP-binding protein [Streptomyces sp. NPDC002851]
MWGRLRGATTEELFGREGELADLVALLGRHRLVTVTGTAGVGKSRLAEAAATESAGTFPDGVLLLRCWADDGAHGSRAEAVRLRGARGRAARAAPGPVDLSDPKDAERLVAWLADRRMLLFLDDLDPARAAGIRVLPSLLERAPGVRVLVTARQPLGLGDERVLRLGPLPVTVTSYESYAAYEASRSRAREVHEASEADGNRQRDVRPGPGMRLFLARARAARPEPSAPSAHEREGEDNHLAAVEEVCRILEGVPLALELAAAHSARIPVENMARLLTLSQSWLVGPEQGLRRHRSVRTAVSSGFTLCERRERIVWARLSVFAGEFDERAAVAVCAGSGVGADEVPAALARLTMASVLETVRDPGGVRPGRYRLPGAAREFGAERLRVADESVVVAGLYRHHYGRVAGIAHALWHGGRHGQALRLLREEAENVRYALRTAPEEGEEAEEALRTAVDLWFWWVVGEREAEGLDLLQRLIHHGPVDGRLRTRGLWLAGWLAVHARDPRAGDLLGRAWRVAVLDGDDAMVGRTLHAQGVRAHLAGDAERAVGYLEEAARITPPYADYGPSVAVSWAALAVAQSRHAPRAALRSARRALADPELRQDAWARAIAQYARALAEYRLGRTGRAWRWAHKALAVLEGLGATSRVACLEALVRRIEAGGGPSARPAFEDGRLQRDESEVSGRNLQ